MSITECDYEGCGRGRGTGHALYRTSPKGMPWVGYCEMHMPNPPDPFVAEICGAIEARNFGEQT